MAGDVKPIRTEEDYQSALKEIERLWGSKSATPEGDDNDEPDHILLRAPDA